MKLITKKLPCTVNLQPVKAVCGFYGLSDANVQESVNSVGGIVLFICSKRRFCVDKSVIRGGLSHFLGVKHKGFVPKMSE